jgi:hypothetical protein
MLTRTSGASSTESALQAGLQGPLGGQIGDVVRVRAGDAGVGQRDHGAARLGQIVRQRVNEEQGRDRVHRERASEVVASQRLERGPRERAAREHHVVQPPDAAPHSLDDDVGRALLQQIGAHERRRLAGRRPDLRRQSFELRGVARREHDPVAALRERLGDRDTEPPRGPHDEHPSTALHGES